MDFWNSNQHFLCTYTSEQLSAKVAARRNELEKQAKYKLEPRNESDVVFGDMKFDCCANSINIGDEATVDMENIRQECTQNIGTLVTKQMDEKGMGTLADPKLPSKVMKIKVWVIEHKIIVIVCAGLFVILLVILGMAMYVSN